MPGLPSCLLLQQLMIYMQDQMRREHDHEWWIGMDLERRGHNLCHLMLGRLETTRKLMKANQCLGISEPCTVWLYSVHHYHYTNLCHGLKMVYVKMEVGTHKPYLHKVYRQRFEATLSEIQSRYTNHYTVIFLLWWKLKNLDVLLTVHFSIFILVINQLDAQNFCFTVSLFCSLYIIIRGSKLHYTASGTITPIGGHLVHRCTCARDGHL